MSPEKVVEFFNLIGIEQNKLLEFSQSNSLKLLVLFGSGARGDYNENSDIDLAFESDFSITHIDYSLLGEIAAKLDIKNLGEINLFVKMDIIHQGLCIYEYTPGYWEEYKKAVLRDWEKNKKQLVSQRNKINSGPVISNEVLLRRIKKKMQSTKL